MTRWESICAALGETWTPIRLFLKYVFIAAGTIALLVLPALAVKWWDPHATGLDAFIQAIATFAVWGIEWYVVMILIRANKIYKDSDGVRPDVAKNIEKDSLPDLWKTSGPTGGLDD